MDLSKIPPLPVFEAIAAQGVSAEEMRRTFNGGVGMLLMVAPDAAEGVIAALEGVGETAVSMGHVVAADGPPTVRFV